VDEVWRRRRAKLRLEEGEAPGIVREVQAHRSSGVTWGRGGASAWHNFKVVADLSPPCESLKIFHFPKYRICGTTIHMTHFFFNWIDFNNL
jgi:hypothetical protein